ncbi:DsbA family protein [Brevundimonas goettingensis]|uniref:DsbA family protein n=1 Tax=Brevundimonas goettingensis TaxID=2774190 RepID=A0A975GV19_9CAUL|nr:DsbA family protein [Brevundimonas goettingensis]QTC90039.1 DsbA family protein [Brevundimonas goettingensis]
MRAFRRLFLILALAAAPLGAGVAAVATPALAGDLPPVTAEDRVLGRADAPVTVVEYASFVCPHCAAWHKEVYPAFKARYIDTGKVKLVYRNLPTSPEDFAMTAAGIARCSRPERFFTVADSLFDGQPAFYAGSRTWLRDAVALSGRTEDEMKACFQDPATAARIDAEIAGASAAGVDGTPTFFVNGRRIADPSLDSLAAAVDAANRPGH